MLSLFLLALTACVRYVPPQSELRNQKKNTNEVLASKQLAGPEEFYAYEDALKNKLESFIRDRQAQLTGQDESYRIGAGDVFEFGVFEFSDLKQDEVEVASDGSIILPLVNDKIQVAGLSVPEMRLTIEKALKRFIINPRVILTMKGFRSNSVAVSGAVAKPGAYALRRPGMYLTDILAEAGGRTDKAGNRILLVPSSGKFPAAGISSGGAIEISYEGLIGGVNSAPMLVPLTGGDTLVVPEAGTFDVVGEVAEPGSYKIAAKTSAFGAIAAAGGFTYGAKVDEVEIIRDIGSGRKAVLALNLEELALTEQKDVPIRDGDVVRVPTASGRHFQRQLVEGLNSVFRGVGVTAR